MCKYCSRHHSAFLNPYSDYLFIVAPPQILFQHQARHGAITLEDLCAAAASHKQCTEQRGPTPEERMDAGHDQEQSEQRGSTGQLEHMEEQLDARTEEGQAMQA